MYDFYFDFDATDKSNILNVHTFLMIKKSVWKCLDLLKKYFLYYYLAYLMLLAIQK